VEKTWSQWGGERPVAERVLLQTSRRGCITIRRYQKPGGGGGGRGAGLEDLKAERVYKPLERTKIKIRWGGGGGNLESPIRGTISPIGIRSYTASTIREKGRSGEKKKAAWVLLSLLINKVEDTGSSNGRGKKKGTYLAR